MANLKAQTHCKCTDPKARNA